MSNIAPFLLVCWPAIQFRISKFGPNLLLITVMIFVTLGLEYHRPLMPFHGNQFRNSINMAWLSRNCHHWSVTQILHQISPWCHTNLVSEWSWCGMGPRIDPNVISNMIRSSAVITRSNITWYCYHHCRKLGRTSIRSRTHKRHPIAHPSNINQRLHPQKTPHTSPWCVSYGVSFVNIWIKLTML